MLVKVLQAKNYSESYILLKEEGDLWHVINPNGQIEQLKRSEFPLDSFTECPVEEVCHVIKRNKNTNEQLDLLLKMYSKQCIQDLGGYLGYQFEAQTNSNICFKSDKDNIRVCVFFSPFQNQKQSCQVEIHDYHLDFLKDGNHEIVIFALEEFGLFYLHGTRLRRQLSKVKPDKKKKKKSWKVTVDYDKLICLNSSHPFHHYSDNTEYTKKIMNDEYNPSWEASNIIDMNIFKKAQNIFERIKNKKAGTNLKEDSSKSSNYKRK